MEIYYKRDLETNIVDSEIYGMAEHFFSAKSQDIWNEDVIWESDQQGLYRIRSFRYMNSLPNSLLLYWTLKSAPCVR